MIDKGIIKVLKGERPKGKKGLLKIWSRRSTVLRSFVGKRIQVYTGYKFVSLTIRDNMVGNTFGDFIATKVLGPSIHISKKKRVQKKRSR